MKHATIADAPAVLNTNDKAMWVLGYNAALQQQEVPREPVANLRFPDDPLYVPLGPIKREPFRCPHGVFVYTTCDQCIAASLSTPERAEKDTSAPSGTEGGEQCQ